MVTSPNIMGDMLDTDINNYDLNDILKLFKISSNFDLSDLKKCKILVLKSHPDKSKLPKEYFLFFTKAYKILHQIYTFKNKSSESGSINYNDMINELDNCNTTISVEQNINDFTKNNKNNFNKKFNKLFEQNNIKSEVDTHGYEDFLISNVDEDVQCYNDGLLSEEQKNIKLDDIREKGRSIVDMKDIKCINNYNNYNKLCGSIPDEYSSDIFSKLPYEDIMKAHTETLIPVTQSDARKQNFTGLEDIKQFRNDPSFKPLSVEQSEKYLLEKLKLEDSNDSFRSFKLAKQSELAEQMNKNAISQFNIIKYN